jgi:tetratricopeptide (TPR) repeat protein
MTKAHGSCFVVLTAAIVSVTPLAAGFPQAPQATSSAQVPQTPQRPTESQAPENELEAARRLSQQGKFDQALAELHELETLHPGMKGLAHEMGTAYYKKSDYTNAIASLKVALVENPADNEAEQLLGLSYYLAGRPAEAIPALEKVQTWYPSANIDASYILGICYIQTKDYPNARKAFAKMFDVPAESAASYLFTARMLLRQDFAPIAQEYAQKAVALDPKLPLAHELLGELYLYEAQLDKAIAEFQKELEINPGYPAAYYKLADCYSRLQKFDAAERLLQRSIWLDPTSTGPYILLGKVLEKKGETLLAVRALQRALAMDPNNPIPHHLLGEAYRDLGRNDDADRELELAGKLEQSQTPRP